MEMGWYPHSGKCDFADHLCIATDGNPTDEYFKHTKIYVGDAGPLRIDTFKDAIPYFPYLVSTAAHSNGDSVIHLTSESYIDMQEAERRSWDEKSVLKYLKRCKRNKVEPSYEDWASTEYIICNSVQSKEIYRRIAEDPKDYYLDNIHYNLENGYREALLKYAEKHGCDNHPILFRYNWAINEFEDLMKEYKDED